jgi:hypothetical protein
LNDLDQKTENKMNEIEEELEAQRIMEERARLEEE